MVKICSDPYPNTENKSTYQSHFDLFSYELSDFQKYAIEAIVDGHHVITAAPTGSGKTLSAEFAIQFFVSQGKRVFYTTPIKALSNQKYYEFTNRYPHIQFGLLTGDIKTNPDADVVIMTAEILTNMLFLSNNAESAENSGREEKGVRGNSRERSSKEFFPATAVVMDEVHYINDEHRGQTWEQTILMLPPEVQMIMLSATLDEPHKFAEWIETCKPYAKIPKQVYLAYTNDRIVPLSHYAYIATTESFLKTVKDKTLQQQIRSSTNKLIKIQTDKNVFLETGVKEVANILNIFEERQLFLKRKFILNNLATFLRENEMLPAICFVFSRKNVEKCASEITTNLLEDDSKVPYIVRRECEQIVRKLPNFQEYLELPEYNTLVALLEKGIGIHHSGMIPILREIVELMISKKYIKLLFATESFSIGLDCPIRTAIFTNLKKFDGKHERFLLPHEYTQSAGRAGRRGIDTIGHVVHCSNLFALPTVSEYKEILCGKPQKLVSKFRIHYSMVLRLIQNGKTNDFHKFAEKSMIQHEMTKQYNATTAMVKTLQTELDQKRANKSHLRTPIEACEKYMDAIQQLSKSVNKKRRQYQRDIDTLKDEYKYICEDMVFLLKLADLEQDYLNEMNHASSVNSFIVNQTQLVCDVLESNGFVIRENDPDCFGKKYTFTNLGKIASNIAEVHPLILSKCMMDWDQFASFSEMQLVAFLSVFTDVKVPEETRKFEPQSKDLFLKQKIEGLLNEYMRFDKIELSSEMYTGMEYDTALMFDLVDDMMSWCLCETEQQCKYFLQNRITGELGISVGDFTKACMKISTISKELSNVCETMGFIECLYKLNQVDTHILKYIATTQSLYV
jgi:superfamily II RNA helicase